MFPFYWMGSGFGVMVAESPFSSRASREQLTQILFEKFNVAGLFMAETGPLALYAMGKTSGLAVDFRFPVCKQHEEQTRGRGKGRGRRPTARPHRVEPRLCEKSSEPI